MVCDILELTVRAIINFLALLGVPQVIKLGFWASRKSKFFTLFSILRTGATSRLIVLLEFVDDGHERFELPVVNIGSTFHLVLHELRELRRVISVVDHVLHEKLLLHRSQLLVRVLVLVEGAARLDDPVRVSVKLVVRGVSAAAEIHWFRRCFHLLFDHFYLFYN